MNEEYVKDRSPHLFQKGNKAASNRGANKVSTKVKESIVQFLEDNIDAIQESFDTLKPKEKLDFMRDILSYAAPKLSATQIEADIQGGINITFEEPNEYKRLYPTQDQGGIGDLDSDQ
jgi:hypothetical protein